MNRKASAEMQELFLCPLFLLALIGVNNSRTNWGVPPSALGIDRTLSRSFLWTKETCIYCINPASQDKK
jgi:hypothetical protein